MGEQLLVLSFKGGFDVSEIFVDIAAARRLLSNVIDGAGEQQQAHNAQLPAFPVSSAGRDFAGHGQRIQSMLAQLHERGAWRIGNLQSTAQSALAQVTTLDDVDSAHSRNLSSRWQEGGVQ